MKLAKILPPIIESLLPDPWLQIEVTEKSATCENCLASRPERGSLAYYDPKLKCCTFHPFIPNFLVGQIIHEKSVPHYVLEVFRKKIKNQEYILPAGCLPPVDFQVAFNNRQPDEFGRKADWLCPFYDKILQQCGIWPFRGSSCATYYCKSDYGKLGLQFWNVLSELLNLLEIRLTELVLKKCGYDDEEILLQFEYFNCTMGTPEELSQSSMNRGIWKQFWAKENISEDNDVLNFYLKCWQVVQQLTSKDIDDYVKDRDYQRFQSRLLGLATKLK